MSKAEELANALENLEATGWGGDCFALTDYSEKQAELAAAELRRLAAVESELAECKAAYESQFKELHALKASIGEPVAKIVYASDDCGTVEWIVHSGRPIRVGQNLYAIKDKP